MERGKIIVVEGIDGSGKATQARLLVDRLKVAGVPVVTFSFPQYDISFMGGILARMLRGEFGLLTELNPYLTAPLYSLDRFEAKPEIEEAVESGKLVVMDRYAPSQVHQAAKASNVEEAETILHYCETIDYNILEIPREDVVAFLYLPPEIAYRLVLEKKQREHLRGVRLDIAETDRDSQETALKMYLGLAGKRDHWMRVDCADGGDLKTEREIHEEIVKGLKLRKILPQGL